MDTTLTAASSSLSNSCDLVLTVGKGFLDAENEQAF